MKQLQLPKMSTDKPAVPRRHSDNTDCFNHLQQNFNRKAPNPVQISDITCIKAGGNDITFAFRQLPDSLNVVQSFSKKEYPFDNACCESFFKYLKKKETNHKYCHSLPELQLSKFEYIEGYYNSKRPHGTLHMPIVQSSLPCLLPHSSPFKFIFISFKYSAGLAPVTERNMRLK